MDGTGIQHSGIKEDTSTGNWLKSLHGIHPLIVLLKSLGLNWNELGSLLSHKVTAFDVEKTNSRSSDNFHVLTPAKLRECARKSGRKNRSSLSSAPDCLPQIIREFGIRPNSLSSPRGFVETLTRTPFSLLWFFAWKYSQSIASRTPELLKRFVCSPDQAESNPAEIQQITLSQTICSPHPVRRLASIAHLAASLCHLFKVKNVYALQKATIQNSSPRPKLDKSIFPNQWISDDPEMESIYYGSDEIFNLWNDIDLASGIKGFNFIDRSAPISERLFTELEPLLSLDLRGVCRIESLHSMHELRPFITEDFKKFESHFKSNESGQSQTSAKS